MRNRIILCCLLLTGSIHISNASLRLVPHLGVVSGLHYFYSDPASPDNFGLYNFNTGFYAMLSLEWHTPNWNYALSYFSGETVKLGYSVQNDNQTIREQGALGATANGLLFTTDRKVTRFKLFRSTEEQSAYFLSLAPLAGASLNWTLPGWYPELGSMSYGIEVEGQELQSVDLKEASDVNEVNKWGVGLMLGCKLQFTRVKAKQERDLVALTFFYHQGFNRRRQQMYEYKIGEREAETAGVASRGSFVGVTASFPFVLFRTQEEKEAFKQ